MTCAPQSFTVGPRFRGVKMLPPGLHHVAYSAPATQGPAFAPTASFFFLAEARAVAVRRWDPATELLLELPDHDEVCSGPVGLVSYIDYACVACASLCGMFLGRFLHGHGSV